MAEELSIVGNKKITTIHEEARQKVTGEAKFTIDIDLPRMLHMKVLRSPHAHATIKKFDASKAEALPGVAGIVSYKELIGKVQGSGPTPGVVYDTKMRYVGDAVAAVAAETLDIAEEALGLIDVKYMVHEAVLDWDEALKPESPRVYGAGNVMGFAFPMPEGPSWQYHRGDVEKGLAEADTVVERTLKTHAQFQAPLEGHSCVAQWEPGEEKLTMWISTQTIFRQRDSFRILLGLPNNKCRIISPYVGGSQGHKGETLKEYVFATLLSQKTWRPVKYLQLREEEVSTTATRGGCTFKWRIGAKRDGSLTAIDLKVVRDTGAYGQLAIPLVIAVADYVANVNFKCPNISEQSWGAFTNHVSSGGYRGFGYFEGNLGFGPAIDELIEKVGMDPVEFHLKNVPEAGDLVGYEQSPLTSFGLKEAIQKCADTMNWKGKWHRPGALTLANGKKHGIGLGIVVGCAVLGKWGHSTVNVKIEWDGTVTVSTGCIELGMGQITGLAQMAAEALGARFEDVQVTFADTETTPFTVPQASSCSTVNTGMPCKLAAEDAKRKLLEIAAYRMGHDLPNPIPILPPMPAIAPGVTVEELDTKEGRVFLKANPKIGVPFGDLLLEKRTVIGTATWGTLRSNHWFKQPNASICEVEVDTETGKVDILRSVVAVDCGRAISPTRVQSQFESVLSGGQGFVLSEEPIWDPATGKILNPNWSDYKLPTTMDTGPGMLEPIILVEPIDPYGPFGAKGAGEAGICPLAAALPNAIYNAIGVRIANTPMTPPAILKALGKI